jgi:hypothetical protein
MENYQGTVTLRDETYEVGRRQQQFINRKKTKSGLESTKTPQWGVCFFRLGPQN